MEWKKKKCYFFLLLLAVAKHIKTIRYLLNIKSDLYYQHENQANFGSFGLARNA
jgi:hypothetical protein